MGVISSWVTVCSCGSITLKTHGDQSAGLFSVWQSPADIGELSAPAGRPVTSLLSFALGDVAGLWVEATFLGLGQVLGIQGWGGWEPPTPVSSEGTWVPLVLSVDKEVVLRKRRWQCPLGPLSCSQGERHGLPFPARSNLTGGGSLVPQDLCTSLPAVSSACPGSQELGCHKPVAFAVPLAAQSQSSFNRLDSISRIHTPLLVRTAVWCVALPASCNCQT